MALLDTLADPLGSVAGGLIDSIGGIFTAKANRNFQREMWNDQKQYNTSERLAAQEYNTSERLATQEYNTPKNQMARLMAAGINPNSALGALGDSTSSPMSSSGASASPSFTDMVNPLDFGTLAQVAAQTRLTNAQAESQEKQNVYIDEKEQLSISQQKHAIELAKSTKAYQDAQKEWTDEQRKQASELFPLVASKSRAERDKMLHEVDAAVEQVNLMKQQVKNAEKQGENIDAATALTRANTSVAYANRDNALKQGEILDYDLSQSKFEETFRQAGIDPHGELGQSLLKLFLTDPERAGSIITNVVRAVNAGADSLREDVYTPERALRFNRIGFDMWNDYSIKHGLNPLPSSLRP